MTDRHTPRLFQSRSLLGSNELDWTRRRLDLVDAHHVAITHNTHGITDGLALSVEDDGLVLRITSGAAYTPYGDLIEVCRDVPLGPPQRPGEYAISLTPSGVVRADRGAGNPGWIRLGTASAVLTGAGITTRWFEIGARGRRLAGAAARAHVASGVEHFTVSVFVSESFFGFFRRFVSTVNGQFERTPIYFASIAVRENDGPASIARSTVTGTRGWFVEVCSPSPTGFTAQLHSELVLGLQDDLATVPEGVEITLSWLGVDHRRPGPDPALPHIIHADRACHLPPTPTPPATTTTPTEPTPGII